MTSSIKLGRRSQGRAESLTLRISPRLKYLIDIAARRERCTATRLVTEAVEDALMDIVLYGDTTALQAGGTLWDEDAAARTKKLAACCPDLLTHDERQTLEEVSK